MTIATLLELAHAASIVHHPQGIKIVRDGSGWKATILVDEDKGYCPIEGMYETPDDALDALKRVVKERATARVARAREEAVRAESELNRILAGTEEA